MRQISLFLSICLTAILLCSCSYQAGNYPPAYSTNISASDSTGNQKIITINGKKYTCINEDGTWRCVELDIFTKKITGHSDLNASEQNASIPPRRSNER